MDNKEALDHLKNSFSDDADFAFVWYANIHMMIMDAGAGHDIAQKAADSIMQLCFGVDMDKVRSALRML
jgi:hypothetical protein